MLEIIFCFGEFFRFMKISLCLFLLIWGKLYFVYGVVTSKRGKFEGVCYEDLIYFFIMLKSELRVIVKRYNGLKLVFIFYVMLGILSYMYCIVFKKF